MLTLTASPVSRVAAIARAGVGVSVVINIGELRP
jgi:hypothetical protein